jgi:hypothetical protein
MSEFSRRALDLVSLAGGLGDDYRKLKGLIERLRTAHSIKTDLEIAKDLLDGLDEALEAAEAISENGQRSWESNAALAMLNSAIILYARATKTRSDHRRQLGFLDRFTEEEKQAHTHLCKLRDDAIAHYGPGPTLEGQVWHEEALLIPLDTPPNDLRLMMASRRLIKQRQLQNLAKKQIVSALNFAEEETLKRNSAVVAELNELANESSFITLTARYQIDVAEFFQSEEVANAVLRKREGKRSGVVNH